MTRITRRFNYTERVRIPASKIHIDVERGADGECEAIVRRLDLSDCGRHEESDWNSARVVVEARRLSTGSYCKEFIGQVSQVQSTTSPFRFPLPDFADDAEITFRIKVVDHSKRLLGEADGVRTGEKHPSEKDPLIYLFPADLKEEIWKVGWGDPDGPRVLVNRRMPNWSGLLTRDPLLRGIVLPQIVREVLNGALLSEQRSDQWIEAWLEFAERLGHDDPPEFDDDGDDLEDWVDAVVQSFCEKSAFVTQAEQFLRVVENQ